MTASKKSLVRKANTPVAIAGNWEPLLENLRALIVESRRQALRAVDTIQIRTCWEGGRHSSNSSKVARCVRNTVRGETEEDPKLERLVTSGSDSQLQAVFSETLRATASPLEILQHITQQRQTSIRRAISDRNARFFEAEAEKLEGWADDLKLGIEREIKEIDRQIKDARRAATTALTLEEKLVGQKQLKALESQRNEKQRSLSEAQDKVDQQRTELITSIEGKLTQKICVRELFTVHWRLE